MPPGRSDAAGGFALRPWACRAVHRSTAEQAAANRTCHTDFQIRLYVMHSVHRSKMSSVSKNQLHTSLSLFSLEGW